MWREPRVHNLDAPSEYKKLINEAIFYNSKGKLAGADSGTVIQYLMALLVSWLFLSSFISSIIAVLLSQVFLSMLQVILALILLVTFLAAFYIWGWNNYEQSWYHFDDENKIFTVIRKYKGQWETIEVPYEQVDKVEYSGGANGYATIHVAGFRFPTARAATKRFASVTEMWSNLARFDSNMRNWPITLKCFECDKEFGHHIGTAQCPFDGNMLIDPQIKGRIDPEEIHPDDETRV